jgi:predicted transcriptional regulator
MKYPESELLVLLDVLIELHRKLFQVERKKLTAVIQQNRKQLEKLTAESAGILGEIHATEESRIRLVEKFYGDREATLSEIADRCSSKIKKDLQKRVKKLSSLISIQKSLNGRIEGLLQSSLEIVDFSLSLISGAGIEGKTYSGSGEESKTKGKHTSLVFDAKA